MRKFVISLAAAGAALAAASPAAAQYYPQQQYGYGQQQYGNSGRYNFGQARELQARLDRIERQIDRLDRRDRVGERSADRLRNEANQLERQLRYSGRNGLNPYEANALQARVARLEQQVQFAAANRNGGWDRRDRDDRDHRGDGRWGRDDD